MRVADITGATLGYLERDGWLTRAIIDQGTAVAASIEAITGGTKGKPSRGVVLSVRTAADAATPPASPPSAPKPPPPSAVRPAASTSGQVPAGSLPGWGPLLKWGGGGLLVLFILGAIFGDPPPQAPSAVPSATPSPSVTPAPSATPSGLSDAVREQCRQSLATAASTGVVLARPTPHRLNVDEAKWALADAESKRVMVQAVACDLWGSKMPPAGEYVVIYGQHSGQRLAQLTEVGLNLE